MVANTIGVPNPVIGSLVRRTDEKLRDRNQLSALAMIGLLLDPVGQSLRN
jgi:hypothetical protein